MARHASCGGEKYCVGVSFRASYSYVYHFWILISGRRSWELVLGLNRVINVKTKNEVLVPRTVPNAQSDLLLERYHPSINCMRKLEVEYCLRRFSRFGCLFFW